MNSVCVCVHVGVYSLEGPPNVAVNKPDDTFSIEQLAAPAIWTPPFLPSQ